MFRRGVVPAVLLSLAVASPAAAQSTVNAAVDWNGNYGFSSNADRSLRLIQSDLIRKAEGDYYDNLGKPLYQVSNNTEIGQQTTTVGAINTATNNIDIKNAIDIGLDLHNTSTNTGCLNGAITIDSQPGDVGATTCE